MYVVTIAVLVAVLATVAVTYAILQEILGTDTVSASVNIVSEADFECAGAIFTGDLSFGTMTRGSSATVKFRIKHIESVGNAPIFIDIRLKSGDQITQFNLATSPLTGRQVVTGDVPGLGIFTVNVKSQGGTVFRDWGDALAAQENREVHLDYTAASNILPGLKPFDILIDVVDFIE